MCVATQFVLHRRIDSLCDHDADLAEYFVRRKARLRNKSRIAAEGMKVLDDWLIDVLGLFGELWESTRSSKDWTVHNCLDAGVLTTSKGLCRNVPACYKAAVIAEARSCGSIEKKTTLGFMVGLRRSSTAANVRKVIKHRCKDKKSKTTLRLAYRAAKSKSQTGVPDPKSFSNRLQGWDRRNYISACKRVAAKQQRFSIALDATEVSFKKVMNATMSLPSRGLQMWMPPMDCLGFVGDASLPEACRASLSSLPAGILGGRGSLKTKEKQVKKKEKNSCPKQFGLRI